MDNTSTLNWSEQNMSLATMLAHCIGTLVIRDVTLNLMSFQYYPTGRYVDIPIFIPNSTFLESMRVNATISDLLKLESYQTRRCSANECAASAIIQVRANKQCADLCSVTILWRMFVCDK